MVGPDEATAQLQGLSRGQVLACAGAPSREAADGNVGVMTYSTFRAFNGSATNCDVSLTMIDGAVTRVTYAGLRGLCQMALKNCLSK